jgi:FKBP-type peptidyl-prolyl cis-trans isomerase FkpA
MKGRIMEKLKLVVFLLSIFVFAGCTEEESNFEGVTRTPQEQLAFDIIRIEGYLEENDLTGYTQTSDGIFYIVEEEGNGIFPQEGQTVFLDYLGTTIDRIVFDQSPEGIPLEFVLGIGQVIEGWDLGIPLFQEDGGGTLIIPSTLAFGTQENVSGGDNLPIQPNSILIFDLKIVALR